MSTPDEVLATVVECITCGAPGVAAFNEDGLVKILMECDCSRPSVEESNAMARAKMSSKQEGRAMRRRGTRSRVRGKA